MPGKIEFLALPIAHVRLGRAWLGIIDIPISNIHITRVRHVRRRAPNCVAGPSIGGVDVMEVTASAFNEGLERY